MNSDIPATTRCYLVVEVRRTGFRVLRDALPSLREAEDTAFRLASHDDTGAIFTAFEPKQSYKRPERAETIYLDWPETPALAPLLEPAPVPDMASAEPSEASS